MHSISYPDARTYFIAVTAGVVVGVGVIEPNQCLTSGADAVEVFTDEAAYQTRLAELGGAPQEQ